MSCKALLFTANTAAQAVAVGGNINPGNVVRRRACNGNCSPSINVSGSSITLNGGDYYTVNATFTVVPTAAGTATVSLVQDGVTVASASETASAAATSLAIPITAVVRTRGGSSVLNFVLSGSASSVTNAFVNVAQE